MDELSLGNRKKVSIVCALQHSADLYVLDEPTSGLDPLMQREFFRLLKEKNEKGASIFLSSHVLGEVEKYCHRAAVIRDGGIVMEDTMEHICGSAAKRVTVRGISGVPGLPLTDLRVLEDGVTFLYRGEAKRLLEALAPLPVTDLTITEPDLEETFLHFYAEGKAAR